MSFTSSVEKIFTFVLNGSPVAAGVKPLTEIIVPYTSTPLRWKLKSDQNTTCIIDILRNGVSICDGELPFLTSQSFNHSEVSAGWYNSINEDDLLKIQVISNTSANNIQLLLVTQI